MVITASLSWNCRMIECKDLVKIYLAQNVLGQGNVSSNAELLPGRGRVSLLSTCLCWAQGPGGAFWSLLRGLDLITRGRGLSPERVSSV